MTPLLTAFTGTPEKNQVYNLDLFELCAAMPSQSVDMILCDLPYQVTSINWDVLIPFAPMWEAFKRITKPNAAIVLTASQPFTSALILSNLKMFKYEWVWDKRVCSGTVTAKYKPLMAHESILVFSNGVTKYYPQMVQRTPDEIKRFSKQPHTTEKPSAHTPNLKPFSPTRENVLKYPSSVIRITGVINRSNEKLNHPTQKPVDLFRYLIRTYTEVGQVVFDPCVGSGTTAVAAREEGRSFIVGDSSLEYVEIARARLAAPYTPSFMPQLELAG